MTSIELRAERAKLVDEARKVMEPANLETRNMTGEEQEKWDKLHADADKLKAQIDSIERQDAVEAEMRESTNARAIGREDRRPQNAITKLDKNEARKLARREYMQHGTVSAELMEFRATGEGGMSGFAVDDGFKLSIYDVLKSYAGVRQSPCDFRVTETGLDYPILVDDDTSNTGELLSENNQTASNADPSFTQVTLKSYMFSSKIMLVSLQSLRDIEALEADIVYNAGVRIARIQNTNFTTGSGSGAPQGIVTGGSLGYTATGGPQAVSGVSNIGTADIYELEHSLDPAYRALTGANGKKECGFMLHDTTLKVIKKLTDTLNRPLWQAGLSAGDPDTVDGYPYYINQAMATPAASAKTVLFAHYPSFVVRDVNEVTLLRLTERYADYFQVGFVAFLRGDSRVKSSSAVKYLAQAAS